MAYFHGRNDLKVLGVGVLAAAASLVAILAVLPVDSVCAENQGGHARTGVCTNRSHWVGVGNKPWMMMHTNIASSSSAEVKIGPATSGASNDVSSVSAASAISGCPQDIDSTAFTEGTVDDLTEHTYSVPAEGVGSFADCQITRTFGAPIQDIQVIIESGQADDIGYVGNTQVTDTKPMCAAIGEVTAPVDVTSQVTVNGNVATLTLRAQENCCCETGWGEATAPGRLNAKLHWIVALTPQPLTVTFSETKVVTGFTKPAAQSTLEKKLTAMVSPKSETNNITFESDFPERATVSVISRDATTGKVILGVKGVSRTPVSQENGDAELRAKKGDEILARANIVVVIPKKQTHDVGALIIKNICRRALPQSGQCVLLTLYQRDVTITFKDQFGDVLNIIYDGVVVGEKFNNPHPGDQVGMPALDDGDITEGGPLEDGVIIDPVATGVAHYPPQIVLVGSQEEADWLASPVRLSNELNGFVSADSEGGGGRPQSQAGS